MIAIKGIRIDSITLKRDDKGQFRASCSYSLISTKDVVLAEQSVGSGYNEMKIEVSGDTTQGLTAFVEKYQVDITKALGLDGDE